MVYNHPHLPEPGGGLLKVLCGIALMPLLLLVKSMILVRMLIVA